MTDCYKSYFELAAREIEGGSYRIRSCAVPGARAIIMAPHGGDIEWGTSEIAEDAAGAGHSLYLFEGLQSTSFHHLHITSSRFDEPRAVELAGTHRTIVTVHGCKGAGQFIYMGGLDYPLKGRLAQEFNKAGFDARLSGHAFEAIQPENICNRGLGKAGVQLEISRGLRDSSVARPLIAAIIRHVLAA